MESKQSSALIAATKPTRKLGLVPEPLSELGTVTSDLLKKHDMNPSCASRAKAFEREMEETVGQLSDKDYEEVLREVSKYWEAQRKGHAGHIVEP